MTDNDSQYRKLMWGAIALVALGLGASIYQRYLAPSTPVNFQASDQLPTVVTTDAPPSENAQQRSWHAERYSGKNPHKHSAQEFLVQIQGAVNQSGIYRASAGTRVAELIEAAGGLSNGADTRSMNLTQKLHDGQMIAVPYDAAYARTNSIKAASTEKKSSTAEAPAANSPLHPLPLNINEASQTEIAALPKIGASMAARIVSNREKYGRFENLEDLKRVKGIGDALAAKLAPFICF